MAIGMGFEWPGERCWKLEELCGYGYMPATLDQFTRELKLLGVSNTLWEVHARMLFLHPRAATKHGRLGP